MSEKSNRRRKLPQWMLLLVSSDAQTITRDYDNNQFDASERPACCDVESEDDDKEQHSKIDRPNTVLYMMSEQELLHVAMETLHQGKEGFPSDEISVTKATKICFRNKTLVNFESTISQRQVNSVTLNDTDIGDNGSDGNKGVVISRQKINKNPNIKINKESKTTTDFYRKEVNDFRKSKKLKTKKPQKLININQFWRGVEPVPNTSSGRSCQRPTGVSAKMLTNLNIKTDQMATNTGVSINDKQWTNENIQKDKTDSILSFTILSSKQMTRDKPDLSVLDEIFS